MREPECPAQRWHLAPSDPTKYLRQWQPLSNKNLYNSYIKYLLLTIEHDVTSPIISIPASARAVLAATHPDAIQPSVPSASMTITKTSIIDLGNNSNRTAGANA